MTRGELKNLLKEEKKDFEREKEKLKKRELRIQQLEKELLETKEETIDTRVDLFIKEFIQCIETRFVKDIREMDFYGDVVLKNQRKTTFHVAFLFYPTEGYVYERILSFIEKLLVKYELSKVIFDSEKASDGKRDISIQFENGAGVKFTA